MGNFWSTKEETVAVTDFETVFNKKCEDGLIFILNRNGQYLYVEADTVNEHYPAEPYPTYEAVMSSSAAYEAFCGFYVDHRLDA